MTRVPDHAYRECITELRAACRRPVDERALETVVGWMRSNFDEILDRPDGVKRWAAHGQRVRDSARHIGALADFFAGHMDSTTIGLEELRRGFMLVRADCTLRSEGHPLAYEYCHPPPPPPGGGGGGGDFAPFEAFLRAVAPVPVLA